jgi:glucan 1,3-beta-glucosidase
MGVAEVWMTPAFFADTGLGWGGSLCSMTNYSRSLTEKRMRHTLKTWITEEDIKQMAQLGFNSIRLPVGYWNLIKDPYRKYAPADLAVSLHYIDWCFSTAQKYGLSVLLDMHGGPGSQNGIDHSGCGMVPQWTRPENVRLSLQAVEAMARRYSSRPNLLGFELLNEPSVDIEANNHDILLKFYEDSYAIIREHSPTALVVFNELYAQFYGSWDAALQEPDYYNVVVDWHLYDWQEPYTSENISEHIHDAERWGGVIERHSPAHPLLIGEWTMSTGTVVQARQPFVEACLQSFSHSLGAYAWNWKVQEGIGFDEWDVQRQAEIPGGMDIVPRHNS